MKAELIEKKYKYTKAVLPENGVEITGHVYIRDGKIYKTDRIACVKEIDEVKKNFSFTLNQPDLVDEPNADAWSEPTLNTTNWPAGVSVNDTIEEFRTFVLADIA